VTYRRPDALARYVEGIVLGPAQHRAPIDAPYGQAVLAAAIRAAVAHSGLPRVEVDWGWSDQGAALIAGGPVRMSLRADALRHDGRCPR
jgi:hypothetical protein